MATDRAGNTNSYAYHSQDIYALMDLPKYSIEQFPVTSELGAMDQGERDTIDPNLNSLSFADLKAKRIDELPYESSGSTFTDFKYDSDGSRPSITLLNLDPDKSVTDNVVGSKTPILGLVSPGPTGAAVIASSIRATVTPLSPAGSAFELDSPVMNGTSVVNFQFALKQGASYLPNGRYKISVSAQASGGSTANPITVEFLIDNSAPQFVRLTPADEAYVSRVDLGGGNGLGVRLGVIINDDNDTTDIPVHSTLSEATASATDEGTPIAGVTIKDSGDVSESGSRIGRLWTVDVPFASGSDLYLDYLAKDAGGSKASRSQHVVIDETPPTVTVTDPPTSPVLVEQASYIFRGTSADLGTGTTQSGVDEVRWWFGASDGSDLPASASDWHLATGTGSWTATQDLSALAEGEKRLYVRAKDGAGNWSGVAQVDCNLDRANPSATMSVGSTEKGYAESGTEMREAAFSLSGDCDDDSVTAGRRAKSALLTVSKDGGPATSLAFGSGGASTGDWTYVQAVNAVTHANDGLYVYSLTVTDQADKTSSATKTVRIDTTPPSLAVSAPVSDEALSIDSYTFQGSAYDLGSGLDSSTLRYVLNGAEKTPVLAGQSWSAAETLASEGAYTLRLKGSDKLGNSFESSEITFYYDKAKPDIYETAIGEDAKLTNADFYLSGTAYDSNALKQVVVSVTKGGTGVKTWPAISLSGQNALWKQEVKLSDLPGDGSYLFTVIATDIANRTSSLQRSVKIDTAKPTITGLNLTEGQLVQSSEYTVNGTASDEAGAVVSGVVSIEYSLDGGGTWTAVASSSNWSVPLAGLLDSLAKSFEVRAIDGAGNVGDPLVRHYKVDLAPPSLEVEGLTEGATEYRNANVSLNGTASDANGLKSFVVSYSKNGASFVTLSDSLPAAGIWSATLPAALGDGSYTISVKATDMVDKSTQAQRTVVIDTTPPSLTIGSPAASELVSAETIAISGTVEDGGHGVASLAYSLDSSDGSDGTWTVISLSGFSWSASGVDFGATQGAKSLWIKASDSLNYSTKHVTFTYDSAPPTLTETASGLAEAQAIRNASVSFGGNVADTNALAKLELSVNGGAATTLTTSFGPWSYTLPSTTDGDFNLVFTATDVAGRTTSLSRHVLMDATKPTKPAFTSSPGAYVETSLVVSGTSGDATSGLASAFYRLDSTATKGLTGTDSWFSTIDVSALAEGPHSVTVWTTDRAGNLSDETSQSFVIDRGNPTITVAAAYDGAVYRNGAFDVDITISDSYKLADSPIATSLKVNGEAKALVAAVLQSGGGSASQVWRQTVPSSGDGVYTLTIDAVDSVGRQASTVQRTITVDTTAPTVTITSISPLLSGNFVNGKFKLSASASDKYGLQGVKYFVRSAAGTPAYTDGDGVPISSGSSVDIDSTALPPGACYLFVLARDNAGNDASQLATVTIDQATDLPAGAISSPSSGDLIGADKKARGTFSDDDGVASGGAVLYVKKSSDSNYTSFSISTSSSATQLVAWTVDLSSFLSANGDGSYDMYLSVTDNAAAKSGLASTTTTTAIQNFTYDNNPPTVSASIAKAPSSAAYKANDALTLSWNASDASGLESQAFDLDGSTAGFGALQNPSGDSFSVAYTVPAGASSGTKTFTLVVTDKTGRSTTRTTSLTIDTEKPTVEAALNLEPTFVGSTPNGAFALKGTAADNRGLAKVQVKLTGSGGGSNLDWTDATLVNGNWSYAIASSGLYVPSAGSLGVEVRAIDQAGNVSDSQSFSQAVDQAADKPTVALISPVGGTTYGSTVQISGTAADDDGLADLDNNGTIDADAITIEYWKTSDPGTKLTCHPIITGSGRSATWNYSLTGLEGASYTVHVKAKDDNSVEGDWSSDTAFTVDTGVPNLVVATSLSTFSNSAILSITGTVEDSGGIKYVHARVNGGSWVLAAAAGMADANSDGFWDSLATGTVNWTINLNLGSDGLKTIEIQASDNNDLIASAQRSTTLDTTAPVGAFDAQFRDNPSGSFLDTSILNKLVRITGTVTELNLRDVDPIEISIEDGVNNAWTPVNGTFVWSHVWDTSALADGSYTLKLRIYDKAGNFTDSIVKTVTTKQSADLPLITQAFVSAPTSDDAGKNVLGSLLKVSGTISDDDGFNSGAVAAYLDGSSTPLAAANTSGATGTWEYSWASLAEGQHYLTIRATDRNGAYAELGPTYFIVDDANPVLALTTPTAGAKVKAGSLTIAGTASDGGGFGPNPISITLRHSNTSSTLNGATYTPSLSTGTFSQSVAIDDSVLDGTLYIDIVLTDRSGKQSSLTRAVTIDTTAPSLNLNSPSSGAYINGLVSVTGTADDLNGLSDVTFQVLNPSTKLPVATVTRSSTTLAAWEFPFNSGTYSSSTYGEDVNHDGSLWKVYFRLAATDNSGNVEEYKVGGDYPYFFIDTNGDKPNISVTQPKNGEKLGGIVNMYGTATDDDGPVMQVEVQIDFNGDGDFADTRDIDKDSTIETGADTDILGKTVKIGDAAHKWEDESAWYVVPVTNNAWTLELNSNGELYPSNTGGTGNITIRVRSRDKFGLASEISSQVITLDETFPRIESVTPLDQTYQHGTFNLAAAFGDNIDLNLSSSSQIRININKTGYQTLSVGTDTTGHPYDLIAALGDPQHGYNLDYPINTNSYFNNSSGILYVDLYVKDESGYTNQKSLSFYVDNQTPTASWSDSTTRPDGSSLRNGMISVNGAARTYIEGNYGDSGSVSGVSHVEVYFVKDGKVLRIKSASGQWSGTPATEAISTENYSLATNTWTGGTDSAAPYVTNAALGDDYVVKVDKPTEMSDLNLGTDLDGDGYCEYMGIYEGKARFRAYFDSQYLPDGLADLHYIVYDLAGNYVHKMRQVFIANNGPVVDRIKLGSDLNNNGVVSDSPLTEIRDYYYPSGSVSREDYAKVKNGKLYLDIEGSDPNGSNKGVKQIFVDVYDSIGTSLLGNAYTSGTNPTDGDAATTLTPTPGTAPWTTAYSGGKADYNLKVTVRDLDDINTSRWVKVSVISPADTTKPVLTLASLAQSDQDRSIGHLELKADNTTAVWSAISAAYGSDDDPKASGSLVIKGTIYDDNRIGEVDASSENNPAPTLATWSSGHLVSVTAAFSVDSEILDESGHTVSFTYKWDTSKVTGVAGVNKTISFSAKDSASGPNVSDAKSQQVDVVPYIKAMARDSANYNTSRSRLGAYVLRQTEEVTVTGFNLFNSTADTISFPGSTVSLPSGSSASSFKVTLGAAATSGSVSLAVSGQPSINNLNDNSKSWNSEYDVSNAGSALWNDDRKIHVWRSDDNQSGANRGYFTGSADPVYPAMTEDGSGVLYGSWSNYANSAVYYGPNNNGSSMIFESYDPLEHTDIHYGSRVNIVINANTYGNTSWSVTGAGGTYVWNAQATNANSYSGTAYSGVYNAEALYHDQKLMQFINQRIATSGDNIHISYYDTDTKALKYWYHQSGVNGAYAQTWINIDGGYDSDDEAPQVNVYGSGGQTRTVSNVYVSVGATVNAGDNILKQSNGTIISASASGVITYVLAQGASINSSIIAATIQTKERIVDKGGASRSAAAGEYSAIDLMPGTGNPVIAYYDITNQTLKLARAKAANPTGSDWTLQTVMSTGDPNYKYSGKYVSMKIDSLGYVHFAFYRNSTGDLIYMKSTNHPTDGSAYTFGNSVIIDSIGSVGVWADISLDGTKPVISYLDSSMVNTFDGVKMAYYDPSLESASGDVAGEPDTIDGWETMNAALGYEVESVRTSVEVDSGSNFWQTAIGYSSSDFFRIAYYVK